MPDCIQNIDEQLLLLIQEHMKNPVLDRIMVFVTSLGNNWLIWIIIALLLLLIKRYQKCSVFLLCSIMIANILCDHILKPIFDRARPFHHFPEIAMLIHRPHSPSFPSGHTTTGFAAATIIFCFDKRFGIAAYLLAGSIAFSRMYLFVHYPTDVLAGIVLGISTSLILYYGVNRLLVYLKKRFPAAS